MYKETHRPSYTHNYAYFYSHLVLTVESHVASKHTKILLKFPASH